MRVVTSFRTTSCIEWPILGGLPSATSNASAYAWGVRKPTPEELQEQAHVMTDAALATVAALPEGFREKLVLGITASGHNRIYELYVPGDKPEDALVISRCTLDTRTGEGEVKVFPERWAKKP